MADGKKNLGGEVAALSEAVRELRDEVAALRAGKAAHACHGCHCGHVCIHPWITVQPWTPTPTIAWTSRTATVPAAVAGYIQTTVNAGAAPAAATLAIGN